MRHMRNLWPEHQLILICRKGVGDFFLRTKLVDRYFEIKKGDGSSYKKIVTELKVQNLDQVIATHESLRTAFFVSKLRAQKKIGFRKSWNWIFFNERIQKNYELPEAIRHLSILEQADTKLRDQILAYSKNGDPYSVGELGKLTATPPWASMSLRRFYDKHLDVIAQTLARFKMDREASAKTVAFFPGSVWATKRWTEEGFIATGLKLRAGGFQILVMGGPGEEALCGRVASQITGSLNLCGQTSIFESALILSQVAAVVGNDSASMHLAATAEIPSVVIFGPTVIDFGFRPWQDRVYLAETSPLPCRPCGKHGHQVCPIGTHVCMKNVESKEVLQKLGEILQ